MADSLVTHRLPPSLDEAVRAALAGSQLDVVVASAGPQAKGGFLDIRQEDWASAVGGAKQAFGVARDAAARWLAAVTPGRIVFVVSTASIRPVHGAALDATVGGFLTTIGQVGAAELAAAGITVNVVAHGWLQGDDEAFVEGIPAARLGRPEEVAAAIAFLASPAASYVNGAALAVDGGFWITKTGGGSPLLR